MLRVFFFALACTGLGCTRGAQPAPSKPAAAPVAESHDTPAAAYLQSLLAIAQWEVCDARGEEVVCFRQGDRRVHKFDSAVMSLAGAKDHFCALLSDHSVWCWSSGPDSSGKPAVVPGLPLNVSSIAAGLQVTCAIASGAPWCWGRLSDVDVIAIPRRIDLPFAVNRAVPSNMYLAVASPGTAAIYDLSCIRSADCFQREHSPVFPSLGALVIDFGIGSLHGCALAANGAIGCFRGAPPKADAPLTRPTLAARAVRFAVLENGGCALLDSGDVECWGDLPSGTPALIKRDGRVVRDIAASAYSICIAWKDGDVSCSGHDVVRQPVH